MKEVFDPAKISMEIETGRVYYPAAEKVGGVGLVRSQLSIHLSTMFRFDNGEEKSPTHIQWNELKVPLTQECLENLKNLNHLRKYGLGLIEEDFSNS